MIVSIKALFVSILLCYCYGRVEEAPDGSVCFNNCNGHGDCIDYSCHCWVGYHGDDCGTTFADESNFIPILSAGHFNLTRKNFTQTVTKHKILLVGFSSYNCHRCIQAEGDYANVSQRLLNLKVPFARANADAMKSLALEFSATELPALVLFVKQRPVLYKGVHSAEAVVTFVKKQLEKPLRVLRTVGEVNEFVESRSSPQYSVSTLMVVGFFSDLEGVEEDDYEDFAQIASDLQTNEDVYFGAVTSAKTAQWFKTNRTIDRTPSMMVVGESGQRRAINLDELYGDQTGPKEWILRNALPLVGKMTAQNFGLYDKVGLPMLMLFLDLTDERAVSDARVVGGRSGGLFNELLIDELRAVAREHSDRILFVFLDGTQYQDQMRSLGLYGGAERLPSLAFNTRDGNQIPFPEELPINRDTLMQFCADFINGKLRTAEGVADMKKKALQTVAPLNPRNKAERKEAKKAPEVVRGVSEQFGDGNAGDSAVLTVTPENFDELVLSDSRDVVLLLHSKGCEPCAHFAVYFKRMAERFRAMDIPTLAIAQMDVSEHTPPGHLNLMIGPLPLVVMVPADSNHPPWTFYSGIGKVQAMMKWVHSQASAPFELPNLPHLSEKDRVAYKEQVREREVALDAKRTEERRAMEAEDRARAETARRRRKEEKLRAAMTAVGQIEVAPSSELDDHDEF